jgi:serine phosphatase RsbU (regulator of sigma subunit)
VIFLAADCTGYGVPGAFISVLGMTSINKLVKLLNITDPGKLLDNLDSDINQFLSIDKKDKDLIIDGMDISVFSLNLETKQLNYCIAKFSCALIRNSELIPLIVQNHSIGYNIAATKDVKFETNTIQLLENDCLYVMSDGYSDQFGGPFNKKYKRKNLVELLLNIHKKPMKEQKLILKRELKEWQRNYSQTDDISVIGIRF